MKKGNEREPRFSRPFECAKVAFPLALVALFMCLGATAAMGWTRHLRDTALLAAVKAGDVSGAEALLKRGADIEARNRDSHFPWREEEFTPLALAASGGNVPMVKKLLAHGADVNAKTERRDGSPSRDIIISTAAEKGRTQIVRLFLAAGADVDARTGMGVTPLMLAVRGKHLRTAELLLQQGANRNARDERGFTAANFAKTKGAVDYRRILRLFPSADRR